MSKIKKQYFCINCKKEISKYSGFYGQGRCKSCASKKRFKNPKNHPSFGKKRPDAKERMLKNNPTKLWKVKQKLSKYAQLRIGELNPMFGKSNKWGHHTIETIRKIFSNRKLTNPNKIELFLYKLLNRLLPNQYKYVGNFKFWIENFNPDFVNVNGQKKIIELYGDYWHKKLEVIKRDKRRLITYKQYGYRTLIIWEHELKDLNKLRSRILIFNKEI